jgi:hypothetical protein
MSGTGRVGDVILRSGVPQDNYGDT